MTGRIGAALAGVTRGDVTLAIVTLAAIMLAGLPSTARAQAPIVATPLPPPDSAPAEAAPPPPPPARAPSFPNVWLPRSGAVLQALDKVNARHAELPARVGETTRFLTLTIVVKSCVVRPPDQPADAAVYVSVTDIAGDFPPFNGWLLRSAPAASMLEHPVYDLRVVGCPS